MSIGTFADRASRDHLIKTSKQKKIVFGEKPTTIKAEAVRMSMTSGFGISAAEGLLSQGTMNSSTTQMQTQMSLMSQSSGDYGP